MKLSQKDKQFLERLKQLVDQNVVWIECNCETPVHFVLRGNYGDQVERRFRLTRQGVRWRFWRLFNDTYVSAYETILFVEKHLGTNYRQDALQIAHDRFVMRQQALKDLAFRGANEYAGEDEDRD
jgi:hypothetical protein